MTVSLRHRRPKGYPVKQYRPVLKQHVVKALSGKGMSLEVIQRDEGTSYQSRMYVAVGRGERLCLDIVGKGDRPNWTKMLNTVEVNV